MSDKNENNLNDQEEVTQFLNSQIPYLSGLKSVKFWKKFAIEGIPVYLLIAIGGLYVSFNTQTGDTVASLLSTISFLALGLSIFQIHNQLKLYRLNEQLRIIHLAQSEPKETEGES